MINVKDKWKSFAIGQTMCSWSDQFKAHEIYNLIHDAEVDDLEMVFENYEIIVWELFEHWDYNDVRDQLCGLAEDAQMHDDLGE